MVAKQLIREEITPLLFSDTVDEALRRMEDYKVAHFPVVDQGLFVGVLRERDLLGFQNQRIPLNASMLHFEESYADEGMSVFDVLALYGKQQLSLISVVDAEKNYLGSITAADLLVFFSKSLSADSPGGVIILEVNENDYSMTEVANIVESNSAKVLSMFLLSDPKSALMNVVVKVNALSIGALLQTFERYGYTINSSFGQDEDQEDLKDNYESLMNYLKL